MNSPFTSRTSKQHFVENNYILIVDQHINKINCPIVFLSVNIMQLRQATTFLASTAFFLPNVNASLLRGVNGEFEIGDNLEISEDRPGTFLRVSESDAVQCISIMRSHSGVRPLTSSPSLFIFITGLG